MTTTYSTDIKANGVAISAPVYGNGTPYYRLKGNNVDYIHKYNSADMWIDTFNAIQLKASFNGLTSDCRGYYLTFSWFLFYTADYDDVGSEGTHTKTVSMWGDTDNEWISLETSSDNSYWETAAAFHVGTGSWGTTTTNYQNGYFFNQSFNNVYLSNNPLYYRFRATGNSQINLMCRTQSTLGGYHTETKTVRRYLSGDTIMKSGRIGNYSGFSPVYNLVEQEDTYYYTGPYQEY